MPKQQASRALSGQDKSWINTYLSAMRAERGLSANTIAAYERDLQSAVFALAENKNLISADADDLREVLKHWAADFSAKTAARKLSALRQFMAFLVAEGHRKDDPSQYLDTPKQPKPLPKSLGEDQIGALITIAASDDSPKGLMLMAMLELLYGAGLRVSEMTNLDANIFNRRNDHITIRGKGGKDRVVMLTAAALDAVEAWLKKRDENPDAISSKYLFPSPRNPDQPIDRIAVYGLINDLGKQAGLSDVTPHTLRHSFATHMLNRGADLRSLQVLLGHADISTTEIYTKTRDDRLAGLVQDSHPLARGNDVDV